MLVYGNRNGNLNATICYMQIVDLTNGCSQRPSLHASLESPRSSGRSETYVEYITFSKQQEA